MFVSELSAEKVINNVIIFQEELRFSSLCTKDHAPSTNYNRQILKFYKYITLIMLKQNAEYRTKGGDQKNY